jgi:hypothetical protein
MSRTTLCGTHLPSSSLIFSYSYVLSCESNGSTGVTKYTVTHASKLVVLDWKTLLEFVLTGM